MAKVFLRFIFLFSVAAVLTVDSGYSADQILYKASTRKVYVNALWERGRLYVDVAALAKAMGGQTTGKPADLWVTLPTRTVLIRAGDQLYILPSSRPGKKVKVKGQSLPLKDPAIVQDGRCYLTLDSLPGVLDRRFSYHIQKRVLTDVTDEAPAQEDFRFLKVRHVTRQDKVWVSLLDVARELDIPVRTQESGKYLIVLPDFTILTLVTGDLWVYRRDERFRPMEDALLSFSGTPHLTVTSLNTVFGLEAVWLPDRKWLKIPRSYGRIRDIEVPSQPLRIEGYIPEPLKLSLDSFSLYDQSPAPVYYASNEDPYESIRDFFTDEPIDNGLTGWNRLSGYARLRLEGAVAGQPTDGGATFEKIGTQTRLSSGGIKWGFPKFQVSGGREYLRLGDYEKQTDLVDQVSLSLSNDLYGDREADPELKAAGLYGEHEFLVFLSTTTFSQSVKFRQSVSGAQLSYQKFGAGNSGLRMSVSELYFDNYAEETLATFNFFGIDPGYDFEIPVDPVAAQTLTENVLSGHHSVTMLDTHFRPGGPVDLFATGSLSRCPEGGGSAGDALGHSWRVRALYNRGGDRVDVSHERASPEYTSLGDPLRYQNLGISRASAYLGLTNTWKVNGDLRREDFGGREDGGLLPHRLDYGSVGNLLYFPGWSQRTLASLYDHSLYGKRWKVDNDCTKFIGRHAVDAGGGWASQWFDIGGLYKQTYIGRLGGQVRVGGRRYSLNEEFFLHWYRQSEVHRHESATRFEIHGPVWNNNFTYGFRPLSPPLGPRLYTASLRFERRHGRTGFWSLFGGTASSEATLDRPEVWRFGIEYNRDIR